MTTRTPSLSTVLQNAITAQLANLHTALPGEVISYDAATRTVNVKPMLQRVQLDPEGNESVEEYPTIYGVPVATFGVGDWILSYPLSAGDPVLVIFMEQDFEDWLETGDVGVPSDDRRHLFSDAVAVPGLLSKPAAESAQTPTSGKMEIGANGDDGQIALSPSLIELGGDGASDWVPLDSSLQSELTKIYNQLSAIAAWQGALLGALSTGFGATAGAATWGTAALAVTPPPSAPTKGSTASNLVKIKS